MNSVRNQKIKKYIYRYSKISCLFTILIFALNALADTNSVDACHEQFQPITVSEIQNIFSDENNYEKYQGQSGYLLFAQKSPNIDNMEDIFALAFKALGGKFWDLKWKKHQGTLKQMQREKEQILDEDGQPKSEYLGMDGYDRYTTAHNKGDMQKAFTNVLAVLDRTVFKGLGWKKYNGTTEQLPKERENILGENNRPKAKYLGMDGYRRYAVDHHGRDMQKAFENVLAVLDRTVFKELGWQRYEGFLEQMQKERKQILDADGEPKTKYLGMDGYIKYTEDYYKEEQKIGDEIYYKRDMSRAFQNVLAVLGQTVINRLSWKRYNGFYEQAQKEREQILDATGQPKMEYLDIDGYSRYAIDYHAGDMHQAFQDVLAVLDRTVFKRLGWRQYRGSFKQMLKERGQILTVTGRPKSEYLGMDGHIKYAEDYYKKKMKVGDEVYYTGDMQQAYENVLVVLGQIVFETLGWQQHHASSKKMQKEREQILDDTGKSKSEYLGMAGYSRYATDHYGGDMRRAYESVKSALNQIIFGELGWRKYHGFSEQIQKERSRILDENGEPKPEYLGMDGCSRYAEDHHGGDMHTAFERALEVLGRIDVNEALDWRRYEGTSEQMQKEKERIFDYGYLKVELIGMDGYREYATDHYEGNMHTAFKNVSAILEGYQGMEVYGLKWNKFMGTVSEYQNLLQLFKQIDIKALEGVTGQRIVTEIIFKGDYSRAYKNVSALVEILLGSREAFRDLNWSLRSK